MTGKVVLVECIEAVDWEMDSSSCGHNQLRSRAVERESPQVVLR